MAFSKECYRKVRDAFEEKREKAENLANSRRRKLYRENPELERIDIALSRTAMQVMDEVRKGKENLEVRIDAIRKQNEQYQEARAAILLGMGYAENEDDPQYECEICEDKGYTDDGMCSCFRRALALEGLKQSGLGTLLSTQSFDTFSLDYYQGQDKVEAERNLRACKKYAEEFSLEKSPNLTFIGGTGLGKTHMSTSIARVVIEKGFDVVYETAQNIMSDFEDDKFSYNRQDEKKADRYMDADLLIIDDLGTEAQTRYTVTFIYNIINTRLNSGKKTIISTNLEQAELHKLYGDRITSRLFGEYIPLIFRGKDIRMQKLQ